MFESWSHSDGALRLCVNKCSFQCARWVAGWTAGVPTGRLFHCGMFPNNNLDLLPFIWQDHHRYRSSAGGSRTRALHTTTSTSATFLRKGICSGTSVIYLSLVWSSYPAQVADKHVGVVCFCRPQMFCMLTFLQLVRGFQFAVFGAP